MESPRKANKHYPLTKDGIREALDTGVSGVYCILFASFVNKRYVGSSKNMRSRLMAHLNKMKKGQHKNRHLHGLYKQWPNEARFYIVQECDEKAARELEQVIIDFTPKSRLYNQDAMVYNYRSKKKR